MSAPTARGPQPDDLLTAREVAAQLAVDAQTVRAWCRKGAMLAIKIGPHNLLRIPATEMEKHRRA